jgi:CRISPR-associated endonuclease Csn1
MQHLPIIDKTYKQSEGWEFMFTVKQNEYFVFRRYEKVVDDDGNEKQIKTFDPKEIDLLDPDNYALISPNLFRVQKFTFRDYWFRHHLETVVTRDVKDLTYKRITNLSFATDVVKVRVNHIGQIVSVGEG